MLDFFIVYILLVLGFSIYFLVKDYESNTPTNPTTNESLNEKSIEPTEKLTLTESNQSDLLNEMPIFTNVLPNQKKYKVKRSQKLKNNNSPNKKANSKKQINSNIVFKNNKKNDLISKKSKLTKIKKLNQNVDIKFINDTHEYYVNGNKVISVTELIDRFSSELSIDNDYVNIPNSVLRRAALKGEALHKEIEDFEKIGKEGDSIEFYNYKKIKRKLNFKVKHSEIMVAIKNSSGKYVAAGRLDMLVSIGSKIGIIDLKRTWKYYKNKVTAQVNLYKLGLKHTYGIEATELHCIRLRDEVAEIHTIKNKVINVKKVLDLL